MTGEPSGPNCAFINDYYRFLTNNPLDGDGSYLTACPNMRAQLRPRRVLRLQRRDRDPALAAQSRALRRGGWAAEDPMTLNRVQGSDEVCDDVTQLVLVDRNALTCSHGSTARSEVYYVEFKFFRV